MLSREIHHLPEYGFRRRRKFYELQEVKMSFSVRGNWISHNSLWISILNFIQIMMKTKSFRVRFTIDRSMLSVNVEILWVATKWRWVSTWGASEFRMIACEFHRGVMRLRWWKLYVFAWDSSLTGLSFPTTQKFYELQRSRDEFQREVHSEFRLIACELHHWVHPLRKMKTLYLAWTFARLSWSFHSCIASFGSMKKSLRRNPRCDAAATRVLLMGYRTLGSYRCIATLYCGESSCLCIQGFSRKAVGFEMSVAHRNPETRKARHHHHENYFHRYFSMVDPLVFTVGPRKIRGELFSGWRIRRTTTEGEKTPSPSPHRKSFHR